MISPKTKLLSKLLMFAYDYPACCSCYNIDVHGNDILVLFFSRKSAMRGYAGVACFELGEDRALLITLSIFEFMHQVEGIYRDGLKLRLNML